MTLDIYKTLPIDDIPEWKPEREIKDWNKIRKIYLDIETEGLDWNQHRIYFIGIYDGIRYFMIYEEDEKELLIKFLQYLDYLKPEIIIGHNIFSFDLPFIIHRAKKHGLDIDNYFFIYKENKRISGTDNGGKPLEIVEIKSKKYQILDTLVSVARWDYINRKLSSYNLKDAVLEIGLRQEQRLELDNPQIVRAWKNKQYNLIKEYLKYDLEDTKALSEYLQPIEYYQLKFLPQWITPQISHLMGNASKWEAILEDYYVNKKGIKKENLPQPDEKIRYEGALVIANEGIYRNVAKVDVSSLYPNIMLRYQIHSRKDVDKFQLRVLKYLTFERLKYKKLAKQGDKNADNIQGAMKVLINSAYGFLGTANIPFNDMKSAELVTKTGQKILEIMMRAIEEEGGIICECDTDGIIYAGESKEKLEEIAKYVQSKMPEGFEVDLEFIADACYVANKKNYVVLVDINDESTWIYKGTKFRGRDKSMIEKDFPIRYVWYYITEGKNKAEQFYREIYEKIENRTIDLEYLIKERRIRKNEKQLRELGNEGDKVRYLKLENGKFGIDRNYDIKYYLEILRRMKAELNKNLRIEQEIPEHFYKYIEYCKKNRKELNYRTYAIFCRVYNIDKKDKLLKEEFDNILEELK